MEYANMVVYEKSKEEKELEGMGTTLEVCLIYNNKVYLGHVGDSRIDQAPIRKKAKVKRKKISTNKLTTIFRFNTFEDYCLFLDSITPKEVNDNKRFLKTALLYTYKNNYYLCLTKKEDVNSSLLDKLFFSLIEFSKYVNNPEMFYSKLKECGKVTIKNNAIEIGYTYFTKK